MILSYINRLQLPAKPISLYFEIEIHNDQNFVIDP
jgi:hypothetical protein